MVNSKMRWSTYLIILSIVFLPLIILSWYFDRGTWATNPPLSISLAVLPAILGYLLRMDIPTLHASLIFITTILHCGGGAMGLYHYRLWDHTVHFLAAAVVALFGLTVIGLLTNPRYANRPKKRILIGLYAFTIALAAGCLWEGMEWFGGRYLGTVQYGIEDTVGDIISDAAGGLVIAILGIGHSYIGNPSQLKFE